MQRILATNVWWVCEQRVELRHRGCATDPWSRNQEAVEPVCTSGGLGPVKGETPVGLD